MPDIESEHSAGYLVGLLHEAGLMSTNGMGPVPLSWGDIRDWLEVTGQELTLWETMMIKKMSEEYVEERELGSSIARPAPYTKTLDEDEVDREAVAQKVESFFAQFKRKGPSQE